MADMDGIGIGIGWCYTIITGKAIPVSTSNEGTLWSKGAFSSLSVIFGDRSTALGAC